MRSVPGPLTNVGVKSPGSCVKGIQLMRTNWGEVEQKQNSVRLYALVAIVLTFGGLFFGVYAAYSINPFLLLAAMIPAGLVWWLFYKQLKGYKESYKETVVKSAAEGMFDRYHYIPDMGFQSSEIKETGLMSLGNIYKSEDTVAGTYKGVDFRRADMYIAQYVSTGKGGYTIVYLLGTWLSFAYNKKFVTDLQIMTKGFHYSNKKKGRFFTRADERRHSFETENMEFNQSFECNCQLDSEAFYLLTPRVMEMLLLLKSEFGCDFMVGFVKNRLHFAINSGKNHMEPPVFGDLSMEREVEKVRRELRLITVIVDTLDLDRKVFVE